MSETVKKVAVAIALKLWRTDATFRQYPYGPPQVGFPGVIAWRLYHWGIRGRKRA